MQYESTDPDDQEGYKRDPEAVELAKKWDTRIDGARKHWEKFYKRVKHNRELVAGFDWVNGDPKDKSFYKHRANLIQGTITAVLPSIYARNPEISVVPIYPADNLKLFCKTLETVTNRYLERADLKGRAKASVRAALTTSYGVVKVMYQRDLKTDPIIESRINDIQENIENAERLIKEAQDPERRAEAEAKHEELEQLMQALHEKTEIVAAEGLVIDRVLTENLIVDPSVCEFFDYRNADWLCQCVPMKKAQAEAMYGCKLDKATTYQGQDMQMTSATDKRLASASFMTPISDDDRQIAIYEIWDRVTQRVYTKAQGCDFWLREPYSPQQVGERWYPFFLLPFQLVDGQFVAPSLVDLTERLQDEHNTARDRYNKHRDLCLPGWIAGADVSEKSIKRYSDSEIGEITIIDTQGRPLNQVVLPRQHPPIDPAVYDTGPVRYDWEQVTGLQDAARSSVVKPKTATEAQIMQQSLSGRVSEFRDQVEDWLQEISQYAAQILLFELTPAQVERVMGPSQPMVIDAGGVPMETETKSYDWPDLRRDQVFDLIELTIRAGTTGAPDKFDQQEAWAKILPIAQGLIMQIMQVQAAGGDAEPLSNLLRETVKRFDERLDVDELIPKPPAQAAMPPGMPPGMSPVEALMPAAPVQ